MCSTVGVRNIAVLIVTFPGVALPAGVTPVSVHDRFFGSTVHSLDGYWREASYGKTSAVGDVYGTPQKSDTGNQESLLRAGI